MFYLLSKILYNVGLFHKKGQSMQVKIIYCNSWNYRPVASRVEDEIKTNFSDARVEKVVGDGGNFIVEVDGDVIFSKKDRIGNDEARFPHGEEITTLINKYLKEKSA